MIPLLVLFPWSLLILGWLRAREAPEATTSGDWATHLKDAAIAAREVDVMRDAVLRGDLHAIAQAHALGDAIRTLRAPLSVLDAQRDLNVLGAEPPLREDGRMDDATARAIAMLQHEFDLPQTGHIDRDTAAAIRYSAGTVHGLDMWSGT